MATYKELNLKMALESQDLPSTFKPFRAHYSFMFGGTLKGKPEEQPYNNIYLMLCNEKRVGSFI